MKGTVTNNPSIHGNSILYFAWRGFKVTAILYERFTNNNYIDTMTSMYNVTIM